MFPKMFCGPFSESLIGKASKKKIVDISIIDIKSFSKNKHKKVDDRPFGVGVGMIISPEPLYDAMESIGAIGDNGNDVRPHIVYMSPQGRVLNNEIVINISKFKRLVVICGHYEGIDERIMNYVDDEISIGDYILTGGEIPAIALTDAVVRVIPGVVNKFDSIKNDSFYNGLLDYPHYTRPAIFKKYSVPKVLLSGNHKKINEWCKKKSYERTKRRRPDLLKKIQ
jgi:tRNA (guanine37-N1)-methyltransferase